MKSFGSNFLVRSEILLMLCTPVTKIKIKNFSFCLWTISLKNILKMHRSSSKKEHNLSHSKLKEKSQKIN